MIRIDNTLISEEVIKKKFICDLNSCQGACCVEGDSGAPLIKEEVAFLKKNIKKIVPFISRKGIKEIEKQGTSVIDEDKEHVTPLVNKKECAYVYFKKGVAKCSIEKAFINKKIDFQKPISCHLYPIRVTVYNNYDAINYHKWNICSTACESSQKNKTPIYQFVKKALIRKYGEKWFQKLANVARLFSKQNDFHGNQ